MRNPQPGLTRPRVSPLTKWRAIMNRNTKAFRILSAGAIFTGMLTLAACGGGSDTTVTRTERTTTVQPTVVPPPPGPPGVTSTTTTTTRQSE
jgi:hypothetical protein